MRITSGGRTQRFSGRGTRRVAAKTKRDPVAAMIRTFGEAHAAAAAEILRGRSEEHTSELQSQSNLVCRLLLEKKKDTNDTGIACRQICTTTLTCAGV